MSVKEWEDSRQDRVLHYTDYLLNIMWLTPVAPALSVTRRLLQHPQSLSTVVGMSCPNKLPLSAYGL